MRVTVEWTIRADGHNEGDRQTVEATPYVNALISGGRLRVLEYHVDAPVVEAPLDAPKVEEVPAEPEVPAVGEPGAEGLNVPVARPGRRRNPNLPIHE